MDLKRSKSKRAFSVNFKGKTSILSLMIILPLLSFTKPLFAQKLATTEDGNIVILFDNGTWKYAPTDQIENSRNHGCTYQLIQPKSDTLQQIAILQKEPLVSHSYEAMKNTDRFKDFVHCDLAIGEVNGRKIAYFDYTLQTIYGLYNHGIIQEGRKLLLKLKDNSTVELTLDQTDKGEVDRDNNETRYHTYAYISPRLEKVLKKNEVDKILMPWSKGNEVYNVIYPRIFIDQLYCFD